MSIPNCYETGLLFESADVLRNLLQSRLTEDYSVWCVAWCPEECTVTIDWHTGRLNGREIFTCPLRIRLGEMRMCDSDVLGFVDGIIRVVKESFVNQLSLEKGEHGESSVSCR